MGPGGKEHEAEGMGLGMEPLAKVPEESG